MDLGWSKIRGYYGRRDDIHFEELESTAGGGVASSAGEKRAGDLTGIPLFRNGPPTSLSVRSKQSVMVDGTDLMHHWFSTLCPGCVYWGGRTCAPKAIQCQERLWHLTFSQAAKKLRWSAGMAMPWSKRDSTGPALVRGGFGTGMIGFRVGISFWMLTRVGFGACLNFGCGCSASPHSSIYRLLSELQLTNSFQSGRFESL